MKIHNKPTNFAIILRIVGELAAKKMQNIILINLRAEKDLLKQYGFAD